MFHHQLKLTKSEIWPRIPHLKPKTSPSRPVSPVSSFISWWSKSAPRSSGRISDRDLGVQRFDRKPNHLVMTNRHSHGKIHPFLSSVNTIYFYGPWLNHGELLVITRGVTIDDRSRCFFSCSHQKWKLSKIEKNYKSWVWLEFTQPEMLNLGQFLGSECGQLAPLPRSSRAQCRPSILEANSAGYGEANMSQLPIATIHCHDFWCIAYYFLYFLGSVIYLIYTYSLYPSIKSRFLFLTFPRDFAILAPPPPRSRWNHRHWNPRTIR